MLTVAVHGIRDFKYTCSFNYILLYDFKCKSNGITAASPTHVPARHQAARGGEAQYDTHQQDHLVQRHEGNTQHRAKVQHGAQLYCLSPPKPNGTCEKEGTFISLVIISRPPSRHKHTPVIIEYIEKSKYKIKIKTYMSLLKVAIE